LEILTFALNWLVKTRRISENPIRGFEKLPLPDPKKIMFDNGHADGPEWQTFFKHVSDSHKDLLLCLYETGCRPGEVFQMRWEWVNQFERSILIPAEVAKTGKARKVPMSAKLFQALSKRPGTNELVFPNPKTGKPYRSVRKAFRGALKRSGLEGKGLTVYSIRRTRLSIWNQVDAIAAMQASGHSLNGSIHYKHYVNVDDRVFGLVKAG
jgi:integrase